MEKLQDIYKVISNEKLCAQFYCMGIEAPAIAKTVEPGQFIHIRVKDGLEPFFRRPFSVFRVEGDRIEIFYEPVGPGTRILSEMKSGNDIDVLGPVGTPFVLPGDNVKQVVMIGGGIGIAPFQILSDVLKSRDLTMTVLYGGRTGGHVYDMQGFKDNGCDVHLATDDGSHGVQGRVSELFSKINADPESTYIYTCGPNPMMAAVQKFVSEHNLPAQAACEEVMACALGACLGCSIKTTKGFKTVCYDGPVFDLHEIIFEH